MYVVLQDTALRTDLPDCFCHFADNLVVVCGLGPSFPRDHGQ